MMIYEQITPNSSYAPWREDLEFLRCHALISAHTLVDIYRCYELWSLCAQTSYLSGDVIEVGVWRGGTAALLASQAGDSCVHLCDTFSGVVKCGENDPHYEDGYHADASQDTVDELLTASFGLSNYRILPGIFPDETGRFIQSKLFRFAHLDVDVYQSAKDSIEWIWPRLMVGGIVVYDDYGWESCGGITKLVNERANARDSVTIHNLNGHAVVVKVR